MKAQALREESRLSSDESKRKAEVDEEFNDFFNQGDSGNYEGGVAYTQPPSKPQPETDERAIIVDESRRSARRAFFARMVAAIVMACIVLVVGAARFKRPAKREGGQLGVRVSAVPAAASVHASPVEMALRKPPLEVAAPPAPEVTEPLPDAVSDEPQADRSTVEATKPPDAVPSVTATLPARPAGSTVSGARLAKAAAAQPPRMMRKPTVPKRREIVPSLAPNSTPIVRKSVAAFPVD